VVKVSFLGLIPQKLENITENKNNTDTTTMTEYSYEQVKCWTNLNCNLHCKDPQSSLLDDRKMKAKVFGS
jgi:hypothetical protein